MMIGPPLLAVAGLVAGPTGGTARDDPPEVFDCGPMALSLLLRLEGKSDDPRAIVACLPARPSNGYSMLQLREAAWARGLKLTGVRIKPGDAPPDRPLIALLDQKPDGHFVVVRPVGRLGKLVQVIDPAGRLEVVDAAVLQASPEWTGLALIPDRPNWWLRLGSVGGLVALALNWLGRKQKQRSRPATVNTLNTPALGAVP